MDTAEGEGVMEGSLLAGGLTLLSLVGCSLLSVAMDRFRERSESSLSVVALLEFCVVEEESLLLLRVLSPLLVTCAFCESALFNVIVVLDSLLKDTKKEREREGDTVDKERKGNQTALANPPAL